MIDNFLMAELTAIHSKIFKEKPHIYYDPDQKRWIAYHGWICGWGDSFKEAWYQFKLKKGLFQL